MGDGRHLRTVDSAEGAGAPPLPEGPSRRSTSRGLLPLCVILALAVGFLAWSRIQVGGRLRAAEAEAAALRAELETRDRVIASQRERLDDARGLLEGVQARVEELRALLEQPLPTTD